MNFWIVFIKVYLVDEQRLIFDKSSFMSYALHIEYFEIYLCYIISITVNNSDLENLYFFLHKISFLYLFLRNQIY